MLLKNRELAEALREKMGKRNQTAFAAWLCQQGVKVNQATISRLLNGRCKTATPKVENLCKYAGIELKEFVRRDPPQQSERLMTALGQAWDGSKAHEDWLARVITTAGAAPS